MVWSRNWGGGGRWWQRSRGRGGRVQVVGSKVGVVG